MHFVYVRTILITFRKGILDKCLSPFIVMYNTEESKRRIKMSGAKKKKKNKKIRKIKVIDIRMEECSRIEWKIDRRE